VRLDAWGPVAALVLLFVVFSIASPRFATVQNLQNMADAASVTIVVAIGMTFVILAGGIDLSVEGVMAVAALVVSQVILNFRNELDFGYLGILLAILVGLLFGILNGLVQRGLRIPSIISTLAVASVGLGVATVLYGPSAPVLADRTLSGLALEKWFGFSRLTYVALAVVIAAYLLQRWTILGRAAFTLGGGEDHARNSGVPVVRYMILLFAVAGLCYGIAGVMSTARLGAGLVTAGSGQMFAGITAVVVGGTFLGGGRGGVLQSVVGALIITVLANGMILAGVSPYLQQTLQGALIVGVIVLTSWPLRERLRVIK
jgi:ribose transport system permease protein